MGKDRTYDALPFNWHEELEFRNSAQYPLVLQQLVDWILSGETWQRSMHGTALFEQIAVPFDAQVRAVVLELTRTDVEDRLRLFSDLRSHADRQFVVREVAFVEEAMKAIQQLAPEQQTRLLHGLHSPAIYGSRSRTVGEDDPEEISLRDGARTIASHYPAGSAVRDFYQEVADRAEQRILEERRDDRSLYERRRW